MAQNTRSCLSTGPERAVLQSALAGAPWDAPQTARLPGTQPCDPEAWLTVDDAYSGQMAIRTHLIAERRDAVIGMIDGAEAAVAELYETVLEALSARSDFDVSGRSVRRPDGVSVTLDPSDPLATLGRLVAEDLCVLERPERRDEHLLTAAVLCFPAHWMLAEKLGRPMGRIHEPVPAYHEEIRRRVQRLFDGLRPGIVLTRMNAHPCSVPDIFTPDSEADPPAPADPNGAFVRSERQCLLRLPRSQAVVFSIQTRMVARAALTEEQEAGFAAYRATHADH